MSLFDVIRYPLSNPVTVEEVRAIPPHILKGWYSEEWHDIFPGFRQLVVEAYIAYDPNNTKIIDRINNLRHRLAEEE